MISRLLTLSAAAAFALSASAALDVTFSGNSTEGWNFGNDYVVADGHVTVDMPGGNGSKYRQDFKTSNSDKAITIDPTQTRVLAVKFIGEMPMANYSYTFRPASNITISQSNFRAVSNTNNTLTTLAGNHILYVDMTDKTYKIGDEEFKYSDLTGEYTPTLIEFKVADVPDDAEVHTYCVDWIKGFESMDALKAAMEMADDGDDDNDEAVDLSNVPVYIKNTNKPYADFYAAYDAAENGDEIVINQDQKVTGRFGFGKAITISGATGKEVISSTFNNAIIWLVGNSKIGEIAFKNLVLTGNGRDANKAAFEINNGNNLVTFENVTFKGLHLTGGRMVEHKNGGKAIYNNVTFEDCSTTDDIMIFLGNSCRATFIGEVSNASVYIEKPQKATDMNHVYVGSEGITGTTIPVTLGTDARAIGDAVVEGTTDVEAFPLTNEGFHLEANEDNNTLVLAEGTSGIEGVAVENAPAVYYNLQGVKVAEPTTGLYIMRQGDKTTKVIIR